MNRLLTLGTQANYLNLQYGLKSRLRDCARLHQNIAFEIDPPSRSRRKAAGLLSSEKEKRRINTLKN